MNTAVLDGFGNALENKRRLAKKVKRRDGVVESAAFQRHRARIKNLFRTRYAQGAPSQHGVELTDDVFVFDRLGNRVVSPITPIDQLARFKKD